MRSLQILLAVLTVSLLYPCSVSASLVLIDKAGNLSWNVLSSSSAARPEIPQSSSLEITSPVVGASDDAKLALFKQGGVLNLKVSSESGERDFSITDIEDKVVEIEERPEVQRVAFGVSGNSFSIIQKNISATTQLPISISPKTAKISIATQSGEKYLAVFPYDAYQSALRAKVLSSLAGAINLGENSDGILLYKIPGEKTINFFDVYTFSMPVIANVSAQTGEIVSTEAPYGLKLSVLF